jgi:hypothetical protein
MGFDGFKSARVDTDKKVRLVDANLQLTEIKEKAQEEWLRLYGDNDSKQIKNIVKEFEAIPFVQNEVKYLLDRKEAELIKKRNQDLFKIKELEKQLDELQKTLKIMKIQG